MKGIEPEAREAAKQAARRAGVTLGAWLNQVIMETGTDEVGGAFSPEEFSAPRQEMPAPQISTPAYSAPQPQPVNTGDNMAELLRQIAARLEQSEQRTFDLAARLDQSMAAIANRLNDGNRQPAPEAVAATGMFDPLERKLSQLSSRLEGAERARQSGTGALDAGTAQTLERAVTSVIDHLDQSERKTEEALQDIREKLTIFSRKIEQSEEAARREEAEARAQALQSNLAALSSRLEKMESGLSGFGPHIERAQAQAVETALKAVNEKADAENHRATLQALQSKLDDVTQRLQRTEKRNEDVLKTFENSLTGIARRLEDIDNTQKKAGEETLRTVESRLDDVTDHLRSNEELALEARRAVEEAMASVSSHLSTSESRGRNSIQALHTTLTKLTERMARVERAAKAAASAPVGFASQAGLGGYPPSQVGFPIPNFDAPPMGGSFGVPSPREPDFPMTTPLAVPPAPLVAEPSNDVLDELIEDSAPPPFADEDVVPKLSTQENYADTFDVDGGEDEPQPELLSPANPQQAQARAAEDFLAAARRAAQAAAHGHIASPQGGFAGNFGGGSAAARYRAEDVRETRSKWLMAAGIVMFCLASIFGIVRLMNDRPPSDTAPLATEVTPENDPGADNQLDGTTTATQAAPIILTPKTLAPETEATNVEPAQLEAVEPENQVPAAPPKQQHASSKPTATPAGTGTLEPAPPVNAAPSKPVTSAPLGETPEQAALQSAAQAGNADAQYLLAQQYASGEGGRTKDMKKAVEWYEKAANQNLATAQYRLATLYDMGNGVPKNDKVAYGWYEKAAALGNVKAMYNMGIFNAQGRGVKQDFAAAARWFGQAAEYGLADGQYNLAVLNERGLGIPQDLATAYKWFAIAADGGDKGAAAKRDELSGKLDAATLAQAKLSVENWSPRLPDSKTNEPIGIAPTQ